MNTDELKRLAEAATPGPWQQSHREGRDKSFRTEIFSANHGGIATCLWTPKNMGNGVTETYRESNATYIAAANPAVILELIAERDALMAELEGRYQSIIEMGNMLTEIVNLIRGEPEEGTSHSTHDAVELVRGLAMHNDLYATAVELEVAKLKVENERLLAANRDCIAHYEDARTELERIKALEPVAVRYDFDGYGWQYIDNGSGSDWLTRRKDGEALYALGIKT